MQAKATSKYVRFSPYKLRPFVNVIRGKTVEYAISWLKTCSVKRVRPIAKILLSAYHNAANKMDGVEMAELLIKEIRVDQGPIQRYYKAGAMGRAAIQRTRLSHVEVIVEKIVR
mgnify:CR=1 FL=1